MCARNHPVNRAQRIRERYPDLYDRMHPHVDYLVSGLGNRRRLSPAEMRHLSQQVATNSNLVDDPPYGLSRNDIRGIAGLLILAALLA